MLAEIGHLSLSLAFGFALLLAAAGFGRARLGGAVGALTALVAMLTTTAFAILIALFVADDFSVTLVLEHSHTRLPVIYKIGAAWGNHEGSLLMWATILTLWSLAFSLSRGEAGFRRRTLAALGMLQTAFIGFALLASNPFERALFPLAVEGGDLNPLLQDPAMMMHPPILYLGYVGFAVPFAMALAALSAPGGLDRRWAAWTRPWAAAAWAFLSVGIALGSWWAYYELGWGGWWFWDPVENASLMPWLCAVALMHSLLMTARRDVFHNWSAVLAISCFGLSLLGAFLVRSGVLVSVHAFAADPARGLYLLLFLLLSMGSALALARRVGGGWGFGGFAPLSRETALWCNNLLMTLAVLVVLCGTLFPLLMQALGAGAWSVGAPYFSTVLLTPALLMLALMGPAASLSWGRAAPSAAALRRAALAAAAAALLGAALAAWSGRWTTAPALAAIAWLAGWSLRDLWRRRRPAAVAHLGVAVCALGVGWSAWHGQSAELRLAPAQATTLAGYEFRFVGEREVSGPNYQAQELLVLARRDGRPVASLRGQKRFYPARDLRLTEAGIDAGLARDLYLSPGERLDDGSWTMRIQYKPLIRLIWLGALMMAAGGALAALGQARRMRGG